jgi:hypothetical protein
MKREVEVVVYVLVNDEDDEKVHEEMDYHYQSKKNLFDYYALYVLCHWMDLFLN